jgi:anthranilate phosphoribosyltransferase
MGLGAERPTWPGLLSRIADAEALQPEEAAWAMRQIMSGEASDVHIASFAVALRVKGETSNEITGLVSAMLEYAHRLDLEARAVDLAGTGGDGAHTVNISTMASIVARAAGARVIKHGNRAVSSQCGSADLLEALGIVVDLAPNKVEECFHKTGIAFCFAPIFHPSFRHAGPARRALGIRTVFNILGPLSNPAQPEAQVIGVAHPNTAPLVAQVLAERGDVSALVFRGDDGLDELSVHTTSQVWIVNGAEVAQYTLDPKELGVHSGPRAALRGGNADHNAEVAKRMLRGQEGPVRDAVLLNAAAAIVAYEGVDSGVLVGQLHQAMKQAADAVDSGTAVDVLREWVEVSQDLNSTSATGSK